MSKCALFGPSVLESPYIGQHLEWVTPIWHSDSACFPYFKWETG